MAAQAKKIIVHGRVQGVGFRYFVQHTGNRLGITGDVRNCPDSTVEIVVEGTTAEIGRFIEEIRKGPPLARVQRLEIYDIEPTGSYRTFTTEGW